MLFRFNVYTNYERLYTLVFHFDLCIIFYSIYYSTVGLKCTQNMNYLSLCVDPFNNTYYRISVRVH